MTDTRSIRAAAAQCAIGNCVDTNLATCLRMLDKAADCGPDIVVLPEFSNFLSWYDDADHCYETALELDDPFLQAIASKAREIGAYVAIGATLKRPGKKVSGSSLLYSPEGELLSVADKQVLIGHENDFLMKAESEAPIVELPFGRLAQYMCMDGVINETPRCLALRGAQVLLNSLNSFAPDEGNLHIPVRAAENKVFVVAANKVGPLVPEAMMEGISAATNIPVEFLSGAGESQIVAPDGTVLAMAKTREEEVVFADIEPALADDKSRPDGTDIFTSRRPALYAGLGEDPAQQPDHLYSSLTDLPVATIQPWKTGAAAIAESVELIKGAVQSGARLMALPGLICGDQVDDKRLEETAILYQQAVDTLAKSLPDGAMLVTSIVAQVEGGFQHQAVLIEAGGIVARQGQVHTSQRYHWSVAADGFEAFAREGAQFGLICADDAIYPESFRLLAMQGVEVVVLPHLPLERWEMTTGLIERAAENRVNLLVGSRPSPLGTAFAAALHEDFTLFGEWKTREFDGVLTFPMTTVAAEEEQVTQAILHPANADNKVVSRNTHLIDNRPWWLLGPITRQSAAQ